MTAEYDLRTRSNLADGDLVEINGDCEWNRYRPLQSETDPCSLSFRSRWFIRKHSKQLFRNIVGLPVRDDVVQVFLVWPPKGFDIGGWKLHNILQRTKSFFWVQGSPGFEAFAWFGQAYPDKLSANIMFDVRLAQEIYAAGCFLDAKPIWTMWTFSNDGYASRHLAIGSQVGLRDGANL